MREDLRVTRFDDGTPIPFLTADTAWSNATRNGVPAVSANSSFYLYNWYAARHPRGICPSGWHVPTSLEQESLIAYFGGRGSAFGGLTSVGPGGFAGLPGGYRYGGGVFEGLGSVGVWWSSSEYNNLDNAWYLYLGDGVYGNVYRSDYVKGRGLSVRCLRD